MNDEYPPRFERVDWTAVERSSGFLTPERSVFLVGLGLIAALWAYDTFVGGYYLVAEWDVSVLDWLFMIAVVILAAFAVVPTLRRRSFLRLVGRRLRGKHGTQLAGVYVLLFVLVSLVAPVFLTRPSLQFDLAFQPPVGFSTTEFPLDCAGRVTGDVFNQVCHGSLTYPLGTNERGIPVSYLLVSGARVALYIVVITAAFVVPLAAAVGVFAGLSGGLVDDLLMGYVDVQLSIPALLLYFVGFMYWGPGLLLLLGSFGLLSWGGIARLVRSETLQRRENGHVLIARSLGASRRYLARRHILPNITNTLVPAVFQLLALFVLVEAGISFLGFKDLNTYSWGLTIADDLWPGTWWVSLFPVLVLTVTLLSFKLLGDGLRDVLDPRGGRA